MELTNNQTNKQGLPESWSAFAWLGIESWSWLTDSPTNFNPVWTK